MTSLVRRTAAAAAAALCCCCLQVVELDERDDGDAIQDYLGKVRAAFHVHKRKSRCAVRADQRQISARPARSRGLCVSLIASCVQITPGRSVPRVFVGAKFIGGGDDTAALHSKGELQGKLEAVGAL